MIRTIVGTVLCFASLTFLKPSSNALTIQEDNHVLKQRILSEKEESLRFMQSNDDFKEIITVRMSYVPSLLSVKEQETLTLILRNIVEEESSVQYSDVNIQILRQIIERKRRDDDINDDMLLVLSISGSILQDSNHINVHEDLQKQFSSGVVKEIRQISENEPFFTNVTNFKIIETPKAFNSNSPQVETFKAPNIVVMETSDYDGNGTSKGDIAAIIGVCILTVGLVALVAIASVFLRRSKSNSVKYSHEDDSSSTIKSISNHATGTKKDRLRNKSRSGLRNNSPYVKKHPWKGDSTIASNEISFVNPYDDLDMQAVNVSSIIKENVDDNDKHQMAAETYRGEFFAPPGKLGVAVDTLHGVPVVHRIKAGSPLQGILFPKDRIISIDEISTTSMTAGEVTKLMVARMSRPRRIVYVRGGDNDVSVRSDIHSDTSFDTGSI